MLWRPPNLQGAIGIAASLALGALLLVKAGEARHWRKQSGQYERLWRDEALAHRRTVASHLAAAVQRAEADARNLARVRTEQRTITERIVDDHETRIAAARAVADGLRRQASPAAADSRSAGDPPVPPAGGSAARADGSTAQDGFPVEDALIATEQAIQLQSLIDWVKAQSRVDHDGPLPGVPAAAD